MHTTTKSNSTLLRLLYLFILLSWISQPVFAGHKWYNPLASEYPVIQNQGWVEELSGSYHRLPGRAKETVRPDVWNLSRNSAGLAVHFYSDAPEIRVRYKVKGSLQMPHMPALGVSGVDLYRINSDGDWDFCFGDYSFSDTIRFTYTNIGKDRYHNRGFEYRLFLPLYNQVEWLEIGVAEESEFKFIPTSIEKPILLYGTSIAQGACASRPGMAWGNIVNRKLDYPLINLGFSGNGRLEKEVLDLISEVDARLYILDCLPNLLNNKEEEVYQLTVNAVKQLREKRSAPILLVEHIGYSNAATDKSREVYRSLNKASKEAFDFLISEGVSGLYYISKEELAIPPDGWVDYIHTSDLGMQAQADAIEKKIKEILNLPVGNSSTSRPVTQRREPDVYEWRHRHHSILAANKENPPRSVILGNSITHFWGGETHGPQPRGIDSWARVMEANGFRNMGYGWDKIENVLWRVYHGELDGFQAENVVVMIGTNNISFNTEKEIADGIRFLLAAIHKKQPQARIKAVGLLPRRGQEPLIQSINKQIQLIAQQEGYEYMNPGTRLLQANGQINESLFSDGLHPNEKGYSILVKTSGQPGTDYLQPGN